MPYAAHPRIRIVRYEKLVSNTNNTLKVCKRHYLKFPTVSVVSLTCAKSAFAFCALLLLDSYNFFVESVRLLGTSV